MDTCRFCSPCRACSAALAAAHATASSSGHTHAASTDKPTVIAADGVHTDATTDGHAIDGADNDVVLATDEQISALNPDAVALMVADESL